MLNLLITTLLFGTCSVQALGEAIDRSDEVKYSVLLQNELPQEVPFNIK